MSEKKKKLDEKKISAKYLNETKIKKKFFKTKLLNFIFFSFLHFYTLKI